MPSSSDIWYIRLPDGQVIRANSTASVRHHLEVGRIPRDCRVRRSGEHEWTILDWAPEFADLVKREPATPAKLANAESPGLATAARTEGDDLQRAGVRGLVDELLGALDSTLNRTKLLVAGLVSLLTAALMVMSIEIPWQLEWPWSLVPELGTALAVVLVSVWVVALLTQMTVVEVSRFRPARWSEATSGLVRHALRLTVLYVLVGGLLVFALWSLPLYLPWLLGQRSTDGLAGATALLAVATILTLVLHVLLWPLLGLTLLFGPIIVVEECSVWRALGLWRALLREHLGRVFLYEALAVGVGTIITVPLLLPVLVAGWTSLPETPLLQVARGTLTILAGLALTPFIAYLIVANVFIYLNLRYDFTQAKR